MGDALAPPNIYTAMMKQPLIIDTDVALGVFHEGRPRDIDDGFAIVEAINSPGLDLVGITTVFGNGPHDEVLRVATELVELKATATPVRAGASERLPQSGPLPEPNDAVLFLAEQLCKRQMAVAAIGPLTNMGLLAHHFPDVMENITQLIIVAGRTPGNTFMIGDAGPVMDFNFENDVRATELVLSSGANVVLAGFELTSQVAVTTQDLATIRDVGTDTATYFYDNSLAWCDHWTKTFPVDAGFHPWDSAAISWLKHPEFFASEPRHWRIVGTQRSGKASYELQCSPLDSNQAQSPSERGTVTYLHGFNEQGAANFVRDVVSYVY